MTVPKQERMTCTEIMYQTGLGSCFPPFASTSYPSHQHYPAAVANAVSSLSPSSFSNEAFSSTKKYGLSNIQSDRYFGPSSNNAAARLGQETGVAPSSRSSVQNISASISSAYSRVGSCSNDSITSFGRSTNSQKQSGSDEDQPYDIKYETPTSCLLIYYTGDAATAVEDHFNRALNTTGFGNDSTSLRSRNLPASFFDSSPTIHQPQSQQYACPGSYTLPYHHAYSSTSNTYNYGDSYYSSSFPTSFHQNATDSWHYAFNTASAAAHRTAALQMAADFTAANRFSSSYNSLLFPSASSIRSSRLENPVNQGKNESPWTATHSVFGTEVPHYGSMSSTDYDPNFSAKSTPLQATKDTYWQV